LGVHLLQPFVFCEFFGHLHLELVFHSLLLGESFGLEFELVVLGSHELLALHVSLLRIGSFGSSSFFFLLLYLKIVSEILDGLLLKSSSLLLL
jgi:hypothetical protein